MRGACTGPNCSPSESLQDDHTSQETGEVAKVMLDDFAKKENPCCTVDTQPS